MGIQSIRTQGFRSLRDISWAPGRLNVIIGPNNAGKSNLLRSLGLLQQAATGGMPEAILKSGGILPLLWDGKTSELRWTLRTDPIGEGRDVSREALTYELSLRQVGKTSAYRVESELLGNYRRVEEGSSERPFKFLERDGHHAVTYDFEQRGLAAHAGSVPEEQSLLSLISGPFGNPVVSAFRDRLASWGIYHDLHVDQEAQIRQPTVARLERRIASDGQNLIPVLHTLYSTDRDFKQSVDSAMRAAFTFGTEVAGASTNEFEELVFPPASDQRVQLRLRWRSLKTEQSAAALSDGTVRFLLLLAIFASPDIGDVIAVDEPEVGLHPSMFPIIAEHAVQAATRAQVFMTTHSPQFLDAFGETLPTTTVLRNESGETRLAIVDGEELAKWRKEYTLGALFRTGELEQLTEQLT